MSLSSPLRSSWPDGRPVVTLLTAIAKGFPALGLLVASMVFAGAVALPVPPAGAVATVSVPVIVCPTSIGIDLSPSPVADSARVPASAAHLDMYSATSAAIQLLGLKGSYCNATIGADGNSGITVVPAGGNPQNVRHGGMTAVIYPACVGCMWDLACPFFPALAQAEAKLYGKCPAQPLGQDVRRLSAETVAFYDPPGEYVPSASDELVPSNSPYPTNGVVVYGNYKYKGATNPMAMGAVCVLPVTEHALCTAVLDEFLATEARVFSGLG